MRELTLLCVHAHPDDEASKGACTVARYHAEGVRTVLVCCTGGEAGDIHNPAMDRPDVRENLTEIRMRELERAVDIIGYDVLELLGYRDSGMPDTPDNVHPDSFAQAPFDEAVERLVKVIRRERPQVVVTYSDEQSGYPHPDHLRVHDISVAAFDACPEVQKLYYTVWSKARLVALHDKFVELGLESPFSEEWLARPSNDHRITTRVDVTGFTDVRRDALLAHATQIDPESKFWFGLPPEVLREIHPTEEYVLGRSRLPMPEGTETDLFAGLR